MPTIKTRSTTSAIIDELPTIYFRRLDNLIAIARSNTVAAETKAYKPIPVIAEFTEDEIDTMQAHIESNYNQRRCEADCCRRIATYLQRSWLAASDKEKLIIDLLNVYYQSIIDDMYIRSKRKM